MKIALLIDQILQRDYLTETLELFCEVLQDEHDITLFTFAHAQGKILGSIEKHSIRSTYLSHMISSPKEINKKIHHIPKLANTFEIDEQTDLVISITSGFAQGIKTPKNVPHWCFVHSFSVDGEGFWGKILGANAKDWLRDSFNTCTKIFLGQKALKNQIEEKLSVKFDESIVEILDYDPPIRLEDFPNWELEKENYFVFNGKGFSLKNKKKIKNAIDSVKSKAYFIGNEELVSLSEKYQGKVEFWGDRCSGETREVLGKALAFIDFSNEFFPGDALCALAMKTPVVCLDNEINRSYFSEESAIFLTSEEDLARIDFSRLDFSPNKLRNISLQYNNGKMKYKIKKLVSEIQNN